MKLSAKSLAAVILVILFGGISATTALGWWQTESTKVPAKITSGEAAGEYDPADIRGSYTFADISLHFAVPEDVLLTAFSIPADTDPAEFAVKDLESLYTEQSDTGVEVGTASVRLFVAMYTGLPFEIVEDTFLLQSGVDILTAKGDLSQETVDYLITHTVNLGTAVVPASTAEMVAPEVVIPEVASTPASQTVVEHTESERKIKGTTTFYELVNWGLELPEIEAILGSPVENQSMTVKDFCTAAGLEFSTIKISLQAKVDALPAE